jgi:hypothetical protein
LYSRPCLLLLPIVCLSSLLRLSCCCWLQVAWSLYGWQRDGAVQQPADNKKVL